MPGSAKPSPGSDDPTLVPENSGTIAQTLTPVPPSSDATTSAGVPNAPPSSGAASLLQAGFVLGGRYEILEALGEGGMGAVYKARDRELDRLVALKVIRPDLARNPAIIQRFKQELILARQITQRNVVRIFDLGEASGIKFITMEYVEGKDLHSLLHEHKKFAPKDAVEIILQVCRALEAAHGEGIIHRDLKPQNIMQHKQGRIVVMDFGLARNLESAGMTQTGALVGTMDYMSPEQALGKDLDRRSDLFALGLIFYELLTGKMPYKAESGVASLLKRTQERAVPVLTHDPTIPTVLSNVVSKCLERDVNLRYQTASEILADLEAWQGGRAAATLRFPTGASPWGQARLPWRWIGAACAIVVLASAGYLLRHKMAPAYTTAGKPVSVLLADFENATGDPVFDGTLEPVFTTALEAAPSINAYKRGSARRIAGQVRPGATKLDESVARLVAVREGINAVVSGSITRDGESYRISVKALDTVSGKQVLAREITAADKNAVLTAVGRLAANIRTALGDTTPESAQVAAAETFTASSLEAAHMYSVAQDLLENQGKSEDAMGYYLKAIELDPNLGRGYAGLAVASVNLKKTDDAAKYYKKALTLLDRMSEREKYRTLGTYYAAFMRNYPQAIQTYEKLVFLYPGDSAGYNNLSIAYVFTLDFPKAVAAIRRALEIAPRSLQYRLNYALYSMYAGDFDTAISQAQQILKENPSYQFAYLPLALSTLGRGDAKAARDIYARFETVSPAGYSLGKMGEADLEMYLGRYREALKGLEAGIAADEKEKSTGEMALKYIAKAEVDLALGQKREAVKAAEKAAQFSHVESVMYPAARVLLQAGEDAKAESLASALDNMLQAQSRSYAKLISGEIALQHKRYPDAVNAFSDAQKLHNSWVSHFLLGRAYLEAAHFGEALAEFELCKKRRGETADLMLADTTTLRYLPPLYYWLARAQQGVGMRTEAQDNLQQFLKLRAEADPGDPLVEESKKSAGGISQ